MRKKKRPQRWTVYIVKEGERREQGFFEFLRELYCPREHGINITSYPGNGGTSTSLLKEALRCKDNYCRVYAWFDEDVPLDNSVKIQLANVWGSQPFSSNIPDKDLQPTYNKENKNPILIVSTPCSCDGFLMELCGGNISTPLTTTKCKNAFDGMTNAKNKEEEICFYKKKFCKSFLQKKRTNSKVLDLLLSVFEKPLEK